MITPTHVVTLDSPIGTLTLGARDGALVRVWLPNETPSATTERSDASSVLSEASRQIIEYFNAERTQFELATSVEGTTFQRLVWEQLSLINYGETITYGELAQRVSRPRASRAVGQANGVNPLPIVVPCHRVLASTGLGGYAGGLATKRFLLELERRS
jgi:methylated-DNA-[protein]-cysteine S-methyltransferase